MASGTVSRIERRWLSRVFELLLFVDIQNDPADVARCPAVVPDKAAARADPVRASTFADPE
jgi:hypothetical protein